MKRPHLPAGSLKKDAPRRRGRPHKAKSDATLVRRLEILLSLDDIARLEAMQVQTKASSLAEVIRQLIRSEPVPPGSKPRDLKKD